LVASLSGFYGALAALLAPIGIYGALSYVVARRKSEIGVRMALVATRGAVVGMILRETAALAAAGIAISAGLTMAGSRAATSLIFGAKTLGTHALIAASVALAALALVASFLPARRAAAIDPAATVRQE
jgi:ABC-type antimicrobial peptide transport system permease subunit